MLKDGTIVKVYNSGRCKLAMFKELDKDGKARIHPIFSGGLSKLTYYVPVKDLEEVNLLECLELYGSSKLVREE